VFDSTKASGNARACPSAQSLLVCVAPQGDYVYTLDAFDASGRRIVHRTLTLHILD
jgi:hypothetical protein